MPTLPWWTAATVYQIYPRSFADSNGDGIGDLPGIQSRLDYLQQLGIEVIWLSPIYQSPNDDNGYDISDYEQIDPTFGTLDDFDALLTAVHERDMKLVMDLVVNHTSDEHPWFVESRSSRDNPKRDWYWWRPARPDHEPGTPGAEPNNWESFFSGPTWDFDAATGEYYLHLFSRKQPDLNWENPEVRQAIYAMMRRWLDRGIDGFRMDVINVLSKDLALPDGAVAAGRTLGDGWPHFICGPRIHEFLAEMHAEVFSQYDRPLLTVGETPGATIDDAVLFTDPERREVDMIFQFEHVGIDHGASKWDPVALDWRLLKSSLNSWQQGLAERGWNSLYWNNHDQPRAVSRFGDDSPEFRERSAKALATILHLQRGTPYVYQGEELGMTNSAFAALDEFQDIETRRWASESIADGAEPADVLAVARVASRDNARTPMQWDASPNAGFTTGEPWLAVGPNAIEINAAAAVADTGSVFHHYRRLIALRKSEAVIAGGDFTPLLADDEHVYAYRRALDGVEVLVVANCSTTPVIAAIDDSERWLAAELLIGNYDDAPTATPAGIELRPWEAVALRRSS